MLSSLNKQFLIKPFLKPTVVFFSETMEASHSQVSQENNEDKKIKEIAKNKGISAVVRYIENNIDSWKKEPVKFGIIGQTATGKSSFVNLVRDVKEGEEGYAKVGRGNTTTSPTPYVHPDNEQIVYLDLPGVGTLDFPKDNYINEMKLQDYDYFFIFFAIALHGEDAWFAEELVKMKKPFCLVKSKVDIDIEDGIEHGKDEKTVIKNLKEKIFHSITRSKHKDLKSNSKLFCISCTKSGVGEIDKLFQHIKDSLSSIKSEAVVYSMHALSQKVIEEKYKSLASRVFKISAGTALIAATPIPVIDCYINFKILVNEIKHYIQVFGLTSKQIRKVSYRDMKQLRCREFLGFSSEKRTVQMVRKMFVQKYLGLISTLSISDIILPIVGSLLSAGSTATIVYEFLNEILENLHQDAIFVHDLILPVPVRTIRTLRLHFEKEGQEGMNRYILDVLNTWKEETVILGVIGEPNSGQIEFINLIRHLKICSSGFATESTTATPYYHPNNEGIIFIGTGLSEFDVTSQLKSPNKMDLSSYDDFFVFLKGDIHTKDLQIFREMDKIEKSFSVIRTKSSSMKPDQETILGTGLSWLSMLDTDMELLVGEGEEIDSDMFRDIICTHMYEDYKNEYDIYPNVCALSSLNIGISEMDSLINHLIQNLPLAKTEAVVNALFPLSKVVIEEKFQSLKKRIVFVTTAAVSKSA